jgi:hypothetical protein
MMNGLFGSSIDDPKTMGVMQLAAGLMGSPRFGQGLSNGLLGYAETVQRAKQQAAAEQMNAMRMEQMKLQMEQQRAQAEQQNRDRTAMQGAFNPLPGPTMDGGSLMPRFDAGSMLGQGASPDAVIQAMQLQTAMNPPPKERVLSEGQSVFGPDGKLLFTNPKQEKPAEQPSSVKEYQFAVSQGYKGTYQQFETAMKRAGASITTVSYGAPVAGIGPDGKPVFFQTSKDGGPPSIVPGVSPAPKEMPVSTREKIAENRVAIDKINDALRGVDARPGSLGAKNYLGDEINQRIDPNGVEVRAAVADIGSQKIHDRSGANVTISEAPRLKPFVPLVTDNPATVKVKLQRLKKEYEATIQALNSGASIQQATGSTGASAPAGKVVDFGSLK